MYGMELYLNKAVKGEQGKWSAGLHGSQPWFKIQTINSLTSDVLNLKCRWILPSTLKHIHSFSSKNLYKKLAWVGSHYLSPGSPIAEGILT